MVQCHHTHAHQQHHIVITIAYGGGVFYLNKIDILELLVLILLANGYYQVAFLSMCLLLGYYLVFGLSFVVFVFVFVLFCFVLFFCFGDDHKSKRYFGFFM